MRGYFDNEDPEGEEPEEHGHDTELTLSTVAQLGIVFGLLLLCGLCFGMGYWTGHRRSPASPAMAATQPATPTAAPDQEPLQGNGTLPKPSADAQLPPPQPAADSDGTPPPATPTPENGPAPTPTQPAPTEQPAKPTNPPAAPAHAPTASAHPQPPTQARTALPTRTNEPQGGQAAPAARPVFSGAATEYMVQIAAVSHAEDANVLVNALRKRGYAANAQRDPSDGLVHVRIGPFATHEEANRMCTRLLEDGYNAMVQP